VRYRATRHGAPLAFAIVVLTVGACSSIQRVPKTAARPKSPPFTSRDGPPTSFINSTADARTTRVIVLRDGLSNEVLFRIATDYLKTKYTVYVSDPKAGFLMTQWEAGLVRDGAPELRYRTRVILRFFGDEFWKQLTVTSEANWLHGDEWEVGYDAPMLDSVTAQLTGILGRRS
jgi:hypothetical protein